MSPTVDRATGTRVARVLVVLGLLLAASLAIGAAIGGVRLDFAAALFDPESADAIILFRTRLPRVLLGAFVGGGLAAAGTALQALLRNALASPDVIGVSGGASVGAVVAIAIGGVSAPPFVVPVSAFGAALATIALIVRLATLRGRLDPVSLLLVGVVVNTVASAAILVVSAVADALQAQGILFWLAGSLAERRYGVVAGVGLVMTGGAVVLWTRARALNLLALGEETARQLGTDVTQLRRVTFLVAALLVGAAVSVSGIIGFVGLIVPHILRLVLGSDLRLLLPASFLGGGVFLVLADAIARVVLAPTEIPVGALTALCGGPFFIALLRAGQVRGRS